MTRKCKHGLASTPEYKAWYAMLDRCNNPKNPAYSRYGGRGISVDPSWAAIGSFIEDMGKRPSPAYSLDRKDNDDGYCKNNCRWATRKVQNDNRSISRTLTHNGETKTLQAWAASTGIKYTTILRRVVDWGWSIEKSLTTTVAQSRATRTRDEKGQYV